MKEHMNPEIQISVIVPAYNVGAYIDECLESLMGQSFKDIEVICVDDCSTDDTSVRIAEWQKRYGQIRLIKESANSSASKCRKDGIKAAEGRYIMFADADDYLEPDACKIAYKAITDRKTDIVHFGAFIENYAGLAQERIQSNKKAVSPYFEQVEDVFKACFIDKHFSHTLWNKIYDARLCKKAIEYIDDGSYPKANDLYLGFFIMYFAGSYSAIGDEIYHYCFGRGMTGRNHMDLKGFERHCKSWKVYEKLASFEDPLHKDGFDQALEKIAGSLLNEQVNRLIRNISLQDKAEALKILLKEKNVSAFEFVKQLACIKWYERADCASLLRYLDLEKDNKEIRTIGLYYRSVRNGGAQRVVANTASYLCTQGYDVILITDEEAGPEDYPVLKGVRRAIVPDFEEFKAGKFAARADAFYRLIDEYEIDALIDSMWATPGFLWDMMSIRSHPRRPYFIVHTHSAAGLFFSIPGDEVRETRNSFSMADAIVTLSKTDQRYWKNINGNVYVIPNPLDPLADVQGKRKGNTVLWLGRLSMEKQPFDAVRIMEEVLKQLPEARCLMVGDGDSGICRQLNDLIAEKQLPIFLEGFHSDVGEYYKNADVLLATSAYEGFGLTLYEAASYALPIVMYEIPWLDFNDAIQGYEAVPQGHVKEAAEKIVSLLSNTGLWASKSALISDSYKECASKDHLKGWPKVMEDLSQGRKGQIVKDDLVEELIYFHEKNYRRHKEKEDELNDKLKRTYREKSQINAKLKQAYADKSERGLKIKALEKEIEDLKKRSVLQTIKDRLKGK